MATNLNFGQALEALKEGKPIRRSGWNGKGMFVYLNKGSNDFADIPIKEDATIEGIKISLFESGAMGTIRRMPNLNMSAATGSTVTGWLASQTDMLAEDWEVIEQ